MIRAARPQDFAELRTSIERRPYFVCRARSWKPHDVAEHWIRLLHERFPEILENPGMDLLIEPGQGWILLQHDLVEKATEERQTQTCQPSWPGSVDLLAEAAARAERRGSRKLYADLAPGEEECYREAGMVAETQRIALSLLISAGDDRWPPERLDSQIRVRPAEKDDRLFLMHLATECVPFMFHERRRSDLARVQEQFFDVYARGDFSHYRAWVAETPAAEPQGAIVVDPRAAKALDGGWEAYIYDISVLPAYWGRAVGAALASFAMRQLREEGAAYLCGDVSTDNRRVQALARRLGFADESRRLVLSLEGTVHGP